MRRFAFAFTLALALAPFAASATTYNVYIGSVSATTDPILTYTGAPTLSPVMSTGTYITGTNIVPPFYVNPASSCGGTGCAANGNGNGDPLETDAVKFVLSGMTVTIGGTAYNVGSITESATYTAAYAGPILNCAIGDGVSGNHNNGTAGSTGQTDCLVWAGATSTYNGTVALSEAIAGTTDYLDITYTNGTDWTISNASIQFNVTPSPTGTMVGVPEPASLALLGTAVAGLGLLRRRRKAA